MFFNELDVHSERKETRDDPKVFSNKQVYRRKISLDLNIEFKGVNYTQKKFF